MKTMKYAIIAWEEENYFEGARLVMEPEESWKVKLFDFPEGATDYAWRHCSYFKILSFYSSQVGKNA